MSITKWLQLYYNYVTSDKLLCQQCSTSNIKTNVRPRFFIEQVFAKFFTRQTEQVFGGIVLGKLFFRPEHLFCPPHFTLQIFFTFPNILSLYIFISSLKFWFSTFNISLLIIIPVFHPNKKHIKTTTINLFIHYLLSSIYLLYNYFFFLSTKIWQPQIFML